MEEEVRILDVKGLNCPMPLLKAKKTLNSMQPLERLKVLATDPGSVRDFEVFARQSGNALLDAGETDGTFFYAVVGVDDSGGKRNRFHGGAGECRKPDALAAPVDVGMMLMAAARARCGSECN